MFICLFLREKKQSAESEQMERLTDHFNIRCWSNWEARSLTLPLCWFSFSHPYFLNLRVVGVGDLKLLCFSVSTVLITPLGEKSMTKDTVLHQCQLWMDSEWKIVSIWVHRNMDFPKFSLAMELCFNRQPLPMSQRFPLCESHHCAGIIKNLCASCWPV